MKKISAVHVTAIHTGNVYKIIADAQKFEGLGSANRRSISVCVCGVGGGGGGQVISGL